MSAMQGPNSLRDVISDGMRQTAKNICKTPFGHLYPCLSHCRVCIDGLFRMVLIFDIGLGRFETMAPGPRVHVGTA